MTTYAYVGKAQPRIDGTDKVTGKRLYTSDVKLARMVHARILRSPLAHARIKSIDTNKAETHPGVVAVLTGRDLGSPVETGTRYAATMAVEEVLFYGQPVAAVLAEEAAIAEEALDLIYVDYEPLPAVIDPQQAIKEDSPLVRRGMGDV